MPARGQLSEGQRLAGRSHPMPALRRNAPVQVFMGAGWQKGTVQESTRDRCTVWLGQAQRNTTIYDARNIREIP